MSEKYEYEVHQWSEDTRSFTIVSDRKLTADEVSDIYLDRDLDNEGKAIKIHHGLRIKGDIDCTYHGTRYGNGDVEYDGDFKDNEEVNDET